MLALRMRSLRRARLTVMASSKNHYIGLLLLSFTVFLLSPLTAGTVDTEPGCGVTLVVIGATGDLARRYLFPAIFDNVIHHQETSSSQALRECRLLVYASYKSTTTKSRKEMADSLLASTDCSKHFNFKTECEVELAEFSNELQLMQLSSESDYKQLSSVIAQSYEDRNVTEVGRVFYLSIPSTAYGTVSSLVSKHARPTLKPQGNGAGGGAWMRVVFEKPFGRDLTSAGKLMKEISEFLSEEEIYLVDHYLGKVGVQQMLPFRSRNKKVLDPLWNRGGVQLVEVVMKERLDVKGRSRFYDRYGVVRDVLQNHHTEIMARLLMEMKGRKEEEGREEDIQLPHEEFLTMKLKALSDLYPPRGKDSLLGQYSAYHSHLWEDGVLTSLGNISSSRTPTFASVSVFSRDPKWSHVPFVLTAGKDLNERTAYARVVFKEQHFSMVSPSTSKELLHCCNGADIVFLIQDEVMGQPGVLASNCLHISGSLEPPFPEWEREIVTLHDSCPYTFMHPPPVSTHSLSGAGGGGGGGAYSSLLAAILDGRRELFIDEQSLMESWRIWTPILQETEHTSSQLPLRVYNRSTLEALNYVITGSGIRYASEILSGEDYCASVDECRFLEGKRSDSRSSLLSKVFGIATSVGSRSELASQLSELVSEVALSSVARRGSFHLALPGGASPLPFYQELSLGGYLRHGFPVRETHVWQTDERCVGRGDTRSNLRQLSEHLLAHLPVPLHQVHPLLLPGGDPCGVAEGDGGKEGVALYERQMEMLLPDNRLDFVVLGVGADGHVASIFPSHPSSNHSHTSSGKGLVSMVTIPEDYPINIEVKRRMTLTIKAILSARNVAVLMTEKTPYSDKSTSSKKDLLNRIVQCFEREGGTHANNDNGDASVGCHGDTHVGCHGYPVVDLLRGAREKSRDELALRLFVEDSLLS